MAREDSTGTAPELELELGRWALAFTSPDVEAAYVAWQRDRSMPFNRAALGSSMVSLALGVVAFVILGAPNVGPVVASAGVVLLASAALLAITHRRAWVAWVQPGVATVNAIFGVAVVAVNGVFLGTVEVGCAVAILSCTFAFAVNRTRPAYAAAAASTYLILAAALIHDAHARGLLALVNVVLDDMLLAISFGSGTMIALVVDADARRAFRQERVIEAQKLAIARERAKSEELLKRELAHQVAERSKELGAALAEADIALDAGRLVVGERFADRYRVASALGAGGMGAVYEVERVTDGARLALKAITGRVSGASAARFAREAEIGARVHHPNLVRIVDVGVASGIPYLVMDLVSGGSLEGERARFGEVDWALPLLRQVAEGVAALHEAGVIHRDLKPANVLLDRTIAKISDFGISRFGDPDELAPVDPGADTVASKPKTPAKLTGTGVVMGTPMYLPPEAASSLEAPDAAADVFAFGVLAYEVLTGRQPFTVPAFVLALAEQPIPLPAPIDAAGVPPALSRLVSACLAADPAARPRVSAIVAELQRSRVAADVERDPALH